MLATPLSRVKNDDKILRPHCSRGPDNIRIGKTSLYWQWQGLFLCVTTSVFAKGIVMSRLLKNVQVSLVIVENKSHAPRQFDTAPT